MILCFQILCVTVEPLKCPENKQTRTGHHPHRCLSSEISLAGDYNIYYSVTAGCEQDQ